MTYPTFKQRVRHTLADHPSGLTWADLRVAADLPHGGPLSDMSLTKAMRTAGRTETVHGFRSSFRDWAAEKMPANTRTTAVIHITVRHGL